MKHVTPSVFLVGQTTIDHDEINRFLAEIDAADYESSALTDGEELVEFYGRLCYRSFLVGLNPNVTRVRTDINDYLANIKSSKHGSVTEHVTGNFVLHNVSRVLTAELCRHRVGTAISQESLRYVRLDNLRTYVPQAIAGNEQAKERFEKIVKLCEDMQIELAQIFDLDNMKNFSLKKEITSAMRRIAPEGLATTVGWSANIRTLRHVIEMRTSRHAEEEIRLVFNEVAKICVKTWPALFDDYRQESVNGIDEWTTDYGKI